MDDFFQMQRAGLIDCEKRGLEMRVFLGTETVGRVSTADVPFDLSQGFVVTRFFSVMNGLKCVVSCKRCDFYKLWVRIQHQV